MGLDAERLIHHLPGHEEAEPAGTPALQRVPECGRTRVGGGPEAVKSR